MKEILSQERYGPFLQRSTPSQGTEFSAISATADHRDVLRSGDGEDWEAGDRVSV